MSLIFNLGCPRNNLDLRNNSLSALQTMKDLRAAEESYKSKKAEGGYGTLKDLVDAGLIERGLLGGVRDGYRFQVVANGESYSAVAVPLRN
jgi:hypothetical protein